MKKLLICSLLFFGVNTYAQELQPLKFSEVVEVPGASAQELHDRCINWFADTFNDSNAILRSSSNDQLIAKPLIIYKPEILSGRNWIVGDISYSVKIQFKEGKFRYIISDFFHHGNQHAAVKTIDFGILQDIAECPYKFKGTTKNWRNKVWRDLKEQSETTALGLIEMLKVHMLKKSATNDNW